MKQYLLLFVTFLFIEITPNFASEKLTLIPHPKQFSMGDTEFKVTPSFKIFCNTDQANIPAQTFIYYMNNKFGMNANISKNKKAEIKLILNEELSKEAYELNVEQQQITIYASHKEGFFYGLESLKQLLTLKSVNPLTQYLTIPSIRIKDEPRFAYRGIMLDVARYFLPKENIIKIIDVMSALKLNKLHLHLVDDNGWRVEILKHPKLTQVGAWRVAREELFPARMNPVADEPTPIGGFYTQDDIKEIVAFAKERMVEVIPEIEMPAHTISSLAAYPELACPVVDQFIGVIPGIGGPAAKIIYCAGNEDVFHFLEDVIDEIVELFPSNYIHLGGDEAQKDYWSKCPLCQKRMKEEHIDHVEELQGYFMNRMSNYVKSKGKKVMGWDEVTNSKLPEDIIVFGWQGEGNAALKAAKQGHKFIMTPAKKLYFIRYQGPQWFEPFTYFGNNTLKDVYEYEPIKSNWDKRFKDLLLGIQGSLWTEFCNSPEDVEYLLFPRMFALAERAWAETNDWKGFIERLEPKLAQLSNEKINYSNALYHLNHKVLANNGEVCISIESDHPTATIKYNTHKISPIANGLNYVEPIKTSKSVEVTAQLFSNEQVLGQPLFLNINWNKATGKQVISLPPNQQLLTNGLRGSNRHSDFEWVGWYNTNGDFIVDLEKTTSIYGLKIGTIINFGMGVHLPREVIIAVSQDNLSYTEIGKQNFNDDQIFRQTTSVIDINFEDLNAKARYVKVMFSNPGNCPNKHVRAGMPTWIYFDEIQIF